MNKEEKEIEYLFAHINRLWAGLMILTGGVVGILLSLPFSIDMFSGINLFKFTLIILGLIVIWLMIVGLINTDYKINKILKGDKNEYPLINNSCFFVINFSSWQYYNLGRI